MSFCCGELRWVGETQNSTFGGPPTTMSFATIIVATKVTCEVSNSQIHRHDKRWHTNFACERWMFLGLFFEDLLKCLLKKSRCAL